MKWEFDVENNTAKFTDSMKELSNIQKIAVLNSKNFDNAQRAALAPTVGLTVAENGQVVATNNVSASNANATISTTALGTAFQGLGASIKTTAASMGSFFITNPIGWITLVIGALAAATAGVHLYNKSIDEAVDNAKDRLSQTESELSDAASQIEETASQIKELKRLEKLGQLSITDAEDLEQLKAQNEELRIRQQYLEKQKANDAKDLADAAKRKYKKDYGYQEVSRESVDAYKERLSETKQKVSTSKTPAGTYLTGGANTNTDTTAYAASQQAALAKESDSLAAFIAQYEYYEEKKKAAMEAKDGAALDDYNRRLADLEEHLIENRMALQGFSDDLSATGESSAELDDVNRKLKLIDDTLLSISEKGFDSTVTNTPFAFTEENNKAIDDFQSRAASLYSTLDRLNSETFTGDDYTDFIQNFHELSDVAQEDLAPAISELIQNELTELLDLLGKNAPQGLVDALTATSEQVTNAAIGVYGLETALSKAMDTANQLENLKKEVSDVGSISTVTIQSLMSKYPQLTEVFENYLNHYATEADVISALQGVYDTDERNYRKAAVYKMQDSADFMTNLKNNNQGFFNELANAYGIDMDNWKTLAEAKHGIDIQLIQSLSGSWSQYFRAIKDGNSFSLQSVSHVPGDDYGRSDPKNMNPEERTAYFHAQKQANAANTYLAGLEEASSKLDNLALESIDFAPASSPAPTRDTGTSGSDTATPTSPQESIETFDFIETRLDRLTQKFDRFKSIGESSFRTLTSRTNAYSNALKNLDEQRDTLKQAKASYMAKADSVGLEESWAKQVRNGSIHIEEIKDDGLKERIKNYQTWYQKAEGCTSKLKELNVAQKELTQANIELVAKKYERLAAKSENANKRISNWIGIKEAWGGSASAKNYTDMNRNISEQIDSVTAQNDALKKLQGTVRKSSDAWQEYNERIRSNNQALQDSKKQMAENARAAAGSAKITADKKVEKAASKDERYDAKINHAVTAKSKNDIIDKKFSTIDERQAAYDTAVSTDKRNFNRAKKKLNTMKRTKANKTILAEVRKYTKSGKRILDDVMKKAYQLDDDGKLYNFCLQYNAYYDAWESDKDIADLYEKTAKQEKADLALEKSDNIAKEYDNSIYANEQRKTDVQNRISLDEAQGKRASTSDYDQLIAIEQEEQDKYTNKQKALQANLAKAVADGSVTKDSDQWKKMVQEIDAAGNAIAQSQQNLVEYKNAIRQINWDTFDEGMEAMKRQNSEAGHYLNLMEKSQKLVDQDTGNFTEYGRASLTLHNNNYKSYLEQSAAYAKAYQEQMDQVARGEASLADKAVTDRLWALQDAQRSAIQSAEDEKQAIADLVRESYDAQLNSLSKLIDKYKDLKNSEKAAYDYQKQIADKTKNIASMQKQLAALGANDTEESRAQLQKLQVQLQEAQEDLKETEYNKFISDTESMLDEMYKGYEDFIDEKLSDTNAVLHGIYDLLCSDPDLTNTLKALDKSYTDTSPAPASTATAKTAPNTAAANTTAAAPKILPPDQTVPPAGMSASQLPPLPSFDFSELQKSLPSLDIPAWNHHVSNHQPMSVEFNGGISVYANDPEEFGRQLRDEICKNGRTTQCIAEAVSAKQLGRDSIGSARLYQ